MSEKITYIKRTMPQPAQPTKGKAIIERSVMENRNLSLGAKGLYSYIQSELTDNGTVKLDINKTCEEMNLSEFDFYRYMKELTSEKIYAI